jgi:3-hydroxyisobutyrate dehydrogenase-like beta-hydroxyacid dehydrogenase
MPYTIAFIGLGVMGYPMAGHLAKVGHRMRVHTRTATKAERWVAEHGGTALPTPAAAAERADFVLACVGNDDDVRAVTTGPDGAFTSMRRGALFIDHTTTSAKLARQLAEIGAGHGIGVLDAPVSGGQQGAQAGTLTVMVGGTDDVFNAARPLIESYARMIKHLGPSGSGQLAKMVNQICIAGLVEALAEGLHFARAVGLDAAAVVEVISKGAAQSWQMEHRAASMLAGHFTHGFAVDWMRKDLAIALDEARRNGARLPVTALVDQLYAEVQALGGGRWDTSSLLARLEALRATTPK